MAAPTTIAKDQSTDNRSHHAPSIAPSSASTIVAGTAHPGDVTPRAHSPSATPRATSPAFSRRSTIAETQPYRGFPSEAHYLAALHAWAEEKKYIHYDSSLKGFFGPTTMEEYASRPKPDFGMSLGLREKWRARKGRGKDSKSEMNDRVREGRRNTFA